MDPISLSVIIPAFNEEARLPVYLNKVLAYLNNLGISYEILVVDDGSVDSTAKVVEHFSMKDQRIKLVQLASNRGKGFAVKTGMLRAIGELRLFADADGATPITELERLKQSIDAGADIAIASRALHDGSSVVRAHLHRKVMGTIFSGLVRLVAVRGIKDTQCGFKLFTAESAQRLFSLQQIDDFGFDVEILFISRKHGYRICEVPVNWRDVKGSKVRLLQDSMKMFSDIFRVRTNESLGLYESA